MPLSRSVTASVSRLRREALFVFSGTVERPAASSLSLIPPGPATAVVRVNRIHHASDQLMDQAGQAVTAVYQDNDAPAGAGSRRVFFTRAVAYGETVGVNVLGDIQEPDDAEAVHGLVERVTIDMSEETLREHLASADAVLHGVVVRRRELPGEGVLSEHSPDWWVADVAVTTSFRGGHEGEVPVRYPNSRDVRWYSVPKLEDGQEAILILHRDGLGLGGAELALLHADDVIPAEPEALDRHRRLS